MILFLRAQLIQDKVRSKYQSDDAAHPFGVHAVLEVSLCVQRQRHELKIDHVKAVGRRNGPPGDVELCDLAVRVAHVGLWVKCYQRTDYQHHSKLLQVNHDEAC